MRRIAMTLAGFALGILVVMTVIGLVSGASQEPHEHFALPAEYGLGLLEHAGVLRAIFALDVAFLVLYTSFFAALAKYLGGRGRPFVRLALGFMIATAVLDVIEDHHILAMLDAAERAVLPSATEIVVQSVISSTKFSLSYIALVLFGLAIPRDTRLGWVLSLFLTAGTLASAVVGYALPPSAQSGFDSGRWVGFVIGFALSIAWLRTQPDGDAVVVTGPGSTR
ncbi:MAG: hypothetical protein ABI467_22905 [Kofleriaceae bacterium]